MWGDDGFIAGNIMKGEIAINLVDRKVYSRDENGIFEFAKLDAISALISNSTELESALANETATRIADLLNEISDRKAGEDLLWNEITQLWDAKADTSFVEERIAEETLERVRSRNNSLNGNINFNGYTAKSIADAIESGDAVNLKTLENYISETNVFDLQGQIDFSTPRDFPPAKKGMRWEVIGAGIPNGAPADSWSLEMWDELVCITTNLGGDYASAGVNFYRVKGRVIQATETFTGTASLATQAKAESGTDDLTIMTPLKVAQKLAHWLTNVLLANAHIWVSKQTFTAAPRFNSTTASQYLKVDASKDLTSVASIPATDISGSKTSSFISDFASAVNFLISSAISALGLGNSATKHVGTAAGTVAAGDDARITGAMPSANVIAMQVASDQTTTSTSLVDVTDLSFSIAANENWIFDFNLQLGTSAANGLRVALSFPTGATLRAMQHGTNNSLSAFTSQMIDTNNITSTSFQAVTTANGFMDIKGSIKNGSNAGTVKVRIQSQNAANTVTVFAKSKGLAIKI
jgi:hypothetical protein